MTNKEFEEILNEIQKSKCETQTLEIKSAELGYPKKLFDTLSSFSNQDEGGVIIFGVDETHDYKEVGVYDPQDLQKKIGEQCQQMEPIVRPLLTVLEKDGEVFVAAEIPGIDAAERPCFYKGKGRVTGSFVRVGDGDFPMTEYEVYSYEAYRKKYQDDIRPVHRANLHILDKNKLDEYITKLKSGKPHLASLDDETIYELMSITVEGQVTLAATLLFSPYPQAFVPQLGIIATVVPGKEIGDLGEKEERFTDNRRIEGTLPEMLEEALNFVRRNMKTRTIIDPDTGKRQDRTEYPVTAIREAVLNALVHRDYSVHTEGMPIQITMYEDRIEITNPGGLYGRIKVDQLGKVQPDTRNPVLANAMETMGLTENRYSGIPTIRKELEKAGMREPQFIDNRGQFSVVFYNEEATETAQPSRNLEISEADMHLIEFCSVPRTRKEIADFFDISTVSYAIKTRVQPLVDAGWIKLTIPAAPQSSKQKYYSDVNDLINE